MDPKHQPRRPLGSRYGGKPLPAVRIPLRNRKGLERGVEQAFLKRSERQPIVELEISVSLLYADGRHHISVGSTTAYLGANITNLTETICGTALASVKNVIGGLPHREQMKIKGFDVILKDAHGRSRVTQTINLSENFEL